MSEHTFTAPEMPQRERKIWRLSKPAGTFEHLIWVPFNEEFAAQYMRGVRLVRESTHKCGRKAGDLTLACAEVAQFLIKAARRSGGRICPAIEQIAAAVQLGRSTVIRCLARLERWGFIERTRRIEPTGNDGAGPQWQQTTNAYKLTIPELARKLLGRGRVTPPPPADFEAAKAAKARQIRDYIEQEERKAREESPLAAAFARLEPGVMARAAAKADERESHFDQDSPPSHFLESVEGKKSGVEAPPRPDY